MSSQKLQLQKPIVIMLYGLPGAGKTYFSRHLTDDVYLAHLNSDKIRHELFDRPQYDKQENSIVAHLMEYMTTEFLNAGASIIFDATTIRANQRQAVREKARKKGAETLIVWFQIDAAAAFERTKKRDKRKSEDRYAVNYSQDSFRKYAAHMQHPEISENYVVISGKHTYNSQKSPVFKKLMEMGLIPAIEAQTKVAKPGLINLVPQSTQGRVDFTRRNINIR